MAFDINDPEDLIALRDEVSIDPILMGYAAAGGGTNDILPLLNDPANNVAPASGVPRLLAGDLWEILVSETITAANENRMDWLFGNADAGFVTDFSQYRSLLIGMDQGLGNAINAMSRPLSRGEVLFSDLDANGVNEFVIITAIDWTTARDFTG